MGPQPALVGAPRSSAFPCIVKAGRGELLRTIFTIISLFAIMRQRKLLTPSPRSGNFCRWNGPAFVSLSLSLCRHNCHDVSRGRHAPTTSSSPIGAHSLTRALSDGSNNSTNCCHPTAAQHKHSAPPTGRVCDPRPYSPVRLRYNFSSNKQTYIRSIWIT